MLQRFLTILMGTGILLGSGCTSLSSVDPNVSAGFDHQAEAELRAQRFIQNCAGQDVSGCRLDQGSAVDTVIVDTGGRTVVVVFNKNFGQIPFRSENILQIRERMAAELGPEFREYDLDLRVGNEAIEELIPNLYRLGSVPIDAARRPSAPRVLQSHIRNLDRPFDPGRGLMGRHIAIWPSHGWYYETNLERWEWQRPRLFQTVEDLLPMSFIVPYLEPMLRRAGAQVYLPRERDIQHQEVIVDNDGMLPGSRSRYAEHTPGNLRWNSSLDPGFGIGDGILNDVENPFREGTYRYSETTGGESGYAEWIPDIPEAGEYAVYVSYARHTGATTDARYTVFHAGGATTYSVDQSMGGGTWTYLGTFHFEQGVRPIGGRVRLANRSDEASRTVSADAVRFGGGMGSIVRGRTVSGRPRFSEAARYYMQFSGMPDTLVYNVTGTFNDYVDDYRGRAEWVNYLKGAPSGPNKDREVVGLGIPIDLSLAFHTDAGITQSDSTIGTLMIYSSKGFEAELQLPDGTSRLANRDLGDIMQTQIVNDLRAVFDASWNRRSIWDEDYSEAVRPNVPGVLLELLSHQNFADMTFALDPRFRFQVGRSIYKSMLRFLSSQNGEPFVVQPLAVSHLWSEVTETGSVRLHWSPRMDPLESTADPTGYIVYTRRGTTAFDNGSFVSEPAFVMDNPEPGVIYSFRVSAVNAGGESEPSEVLAVGLADDAGVPAGNSRAPVLVINGFDRISGPARIEQGSWRGFAGFVDEGVPDRRDVAFVGNQYDYESSSPFVDDDSPGHGASHASFETRAITGNTFDYAAIHGAALMASGRSFVSASNEAVGDRLVDLEQFELVDIILGEQRTTFGPGELKGPTFRTFSLRLQTALKNYVDRGGDLFISGAYVGTDLNGADSREDDRRFSEEVLRLKWRTNHASESGRVIAANDHLVPFGTAFTYNTDPTGDVYRVEAPDAVEPIDDDGATLLRYGDNGTSAAYGYRGRSGIVVLGFPFETIGSQDERVQMMQAVLTYLSDSE